MDLEKYVAKVPGFPKEGIVFLDVTPIFRNGEAYNYAITKLADYAKSKGANVVVGPEARGFMTGCPVATKLNIGFAPIRKPGKLPREVVTEDYDLEYGKNTLCLHKDAIKPGDKVVIIDDLLATGGTVRAGINLVERLGGEVVGIAFLIELTDLNGKDLLEGYDVYSLMEFKEKE